MEKANESALSDENRINREIMNLLNCQLTTKSTRNDNVEDLDNDLMNVLADIKQLIEKQEKGDNYQFLNDEKFSQDFLKTNQFEAAEDSNNANVKLSKNNIPSNEIDINEESKKRSPVYSEKTNINKKNCSNKRQMLNKNLLNLIKAVIADRTEKQKELEETQSAVRGLQNMLNEKEEAFIKERQKYKYDLQLLEELKAVVKDSRNESKRMTNKYEEERKRANEINLIKCEIEKSNDRLKEQVEQLKNENNVFATFLSAKSSEGEKVNARMKELNENIENLKKIIVEKEKKISEIEEKLKDKDTSLSLVNEELKKLIDQKHKEKSEYYEKLYKNVGRHNDYLIKELNKLLNEKCVKRNENNDMKNQNEDIVEFCIDDVPKDINKDQIYIKEKTKDYEREKDFKSNDYIKKFKEELTKKRTNKNEQTPIENKTNTDFLSLNSSSTEKNQNISQKGDTTYSKVFNHKNAAVGKKDPNNIDFLNSTDNISIDSKVYDDKKSKKTVDNETIDEITKKIQNISLTNKYKKRLRHLKRKYKKTEDDNIKFRTEIENHKNQIFKLAEEIKNLKSTEFNTFSNNLKDSLNAKSEIDFPVKQ
ncbi:hypothetical protein EDEG_00043, partial [Edhazardia aedis USNM 41457]